MKLVVLKNHLRGQIWYRSLDPVKKQPHSTPMTAEPVFDLVSAMLMNQKLKAHHPTIHRAMLKQMDGMETATDVATLAECYRFIERQELDSIPNNDRRILKLNKMRPHE